MYNHYTFQSNVEIQCPSDEGYPGQHLRMHMQVICLVDVPIDAYTLFAHVQQMYIECLLF